MMGFLGVLAGVAGGLFSGGALGGALGGAQAASEAAFAANQAELLASDTQLNTQAVKMAETTNTQEFSVAVDEAHNHVVRSYIEAVKQVQ
jgi:hypothetical protein